MCWRGLRRKQRRQEGVILVCSPARVGVCPCVKGWACLAQNTDCTSSTNLCTKTPLGGWRGGEQAHILQCGRQHWEASKLPLNSWAVGRDGYTGENKRRSGGEGGGGEEPISRFSSCKSRPGWSKAKTLFLLPILLCRKPSTFYCCACSLSLSRKTQTTKKMFSIKRHHIKDPPPAWISGSCYLVVESILSHVNEVSKQIDLWCFCAMPDWTLPFTTRQIVWRRWNDNFIASVRPWNWDQKSAPLIPLED